MKLASWGNSEQVGVDIPLRFIFKPSYSPHGININVVSNGVWTAWTPE
jgi:hypothetical protein